MGNTEMKKWVSHKKVWAEKITDIVILNNSENTDRIMLANNGYVDKDHEWFKSKLPKDFDKSVDLGYYVVYEGGYSSWSPTKAFEEGYTPIKEETSPGPFGLLQLGRGTFGQAIEAAKQGKRVARKGWNGAGMFAYIVPAASYPAQTGAAKSYFGHETMVPYRAYWALKTAQNDVATWAPSGSDSLAEDWMIVE